MEKKKIIIIAISLITFGTFAYFIFFSKNTNESNDTQSFGGKYNQKQKPKSEKKNKTPPEAKGFASASLMSSSSTPASPNASSQSNKSSSIFNGSSNGSNSKFSSQTYFSKTPLLKLNQINGLSNRNSWLSSSQDDSSGGGSGGGSGSGGGGGSGSGGGGSSGVGGSSPANYTKRIQDCVSIVQPLLTQNITDSTTIKNTLLSVMGFSMMPIDTQDISVTSIATQKYGNAAGNYCTNIVKLTDAQLIDAAQIYNDCKTMVKNLYAAKGSNVSESDAITAFASLNIMNGVTNQAQQKEILQNYLGSSYNEIISTMKNLNGNSLDIQSTTICGSTSHSVVNGVNATSPYLDCVRTLKLAKTNKSDIRAAIPSYSQLSPTNQTKITSSYSDFLSGKTTAEIICNFIADNTLAASTQSSGTSPVLTSESTQAGCITLINTIQSEYDAYRSNKDSEPITNIINKVDRYQFFIPETYRSYVIKYALTEAVSNGNFKNFSQSQQGQIGQRLYETSANLSSSQSVIVGNIYKELYPNLCKCTHMDFDDISWKNSLKTYIGIKGGAGGTPIPIDAVTQQSLIASSDFYKSCPVKIVSNFTINTTTTQLIVDAVKSVNDDYKNISNIESKVAGLSCYVSKCIGQTCPQSCTQIVDSICQTVAIQYIKTNPAAIDVNNIFKCPISQSSANNDTKICYNLNDDQRLAIAEDLYTAINKFQTNGISIRKKIVEDLWNIHNDKQNATNTSVSSSQCIEAANTRWNEYLKPYITPSS